MEANNKFRSPFKPVIAVVKTTMSPAAGPETLMLDLLISPTTIPPNIPATIPESGVTPLACAMPSQRGKATMNTTSDEYKSCG